LRLRLGGAGIIGLGGRGARILIAGIHRLIFVACGRIPVRIDSADLGERGRRDQQAGYGSQPQQTVLEHYATPPPWSRGG
jgi:hypothetical protein